jgi:hypothetical protein
MSLTATGVPTPMDSTSGMPKPSSWDAVTSAVADRSASRYSSSEAPSWNTTAPAGASASSRVRSAADTRDMQCSVQSAPRSGSAAASVSTFLYGMNDPM